ncbi:hypothetical protein A7A76_10590 [Lysobacter enzymogenes]|uniref:hypothetical protein n=1 Tax=Lysobacter enzymogenes TaxID=69 RepID=UPI0019D024FD|nr:hypothetical protein [Lysobacter enzymogenes]MBN7135199.1 hypothetical protein [Lysobacter enzymogenes]
MKPSLAVLVLICAAAAACSKPQPPEKERPVDPQATQMRDAIQKPIQQAKDAASGSVDQGAQNTRDAVEAAGG